MKLSQPTERRQLVICKFVEFFYRSQANFPVFATCVIRLTVSNSKVMVRFFDTSMKCIPNSNVTIVDNAICKMICNDDFFEFTMAELKNVTHTYFDKDDIVRLKAEGFQEQFEEKEEEMSLNQFKPEIIENARGTLFKDLPLGAGFRHPELKGLCIKTSGAREGVNGLVFDSVETVCIGLAWDDLVEPVKLKIEVV